MGAKTFWLEPSGEVLVGLRRYAKAGMTEKCSVNPMGYHTTTVFTGRETAEHDERGYLTNTKTWVDASNADPNLDWPTQCVCGYEYQPEDNWQEWVEEIYKRRDTGEELTLRPFGLVSNSPVPAAGPGAMWNAFWMPSAEKNPDGIYLMVRCPEDGHDWAVDSRASNCTMPEDNEHRCWVRHGDPREANVTVDKNGLSCQAGAGSIQTPTWHGFLRNGELVT